MCTCVGGGECMYMSGCRYMTRHSRIRLICIHMYVNRIDMYVKHV